MPTSNDEPVITRGMFAGWVAAALLGGLVASGVSRLWPNDPPSVRQTASGSKDSAPGLPTSGSREFTEFFPPLSAVEQRIEKALDEPVSCDFVNTPLTEVVKFFAKSIPVNIGIDTESLTEAGIEINTRITRKANNLRLRSALHWILSPLALTTVIEDDSVKITTVANAQGKLFTRTYPVADLCRIPSEKGVYDVQCLIQLIEEGTSEPWQNTVGMGGVITDLPSTGSMTIRQTANGHREVLDLLRSLRRAQRQDLALLDDATLKRWDEQRASAAAAAIPRPTPVEFVEVIDTRQSDAERRIEQALDKSITVNFQQTPLTEVVEFLGKQLAIHVLLDNESLNSEGIGTDTPISLQLNPITARSLLPLLFRPLQLDFVVEHDVLLVTTYVRSRERLTARTYPVADLIGPTRDFQSLIRALEETTKGPWQNKVGDGGTVCELWETGSLVVQQTRSGHEEVLQVIRSQREALRHNPNSIRQPSSPATPRKKNINGNPGGGYF